MRKRISAYARELRDAVSAAKKARRVPYELTETGWTDEELADLPDGPPAEPDDES